MIMGCPSCGKGMGVPEQYAGQLMRCSSCQELVQIPDRASMEAAGVAAGVAAPAATGSAAEILGYAGTDYQKPETVEPSPQPSPVPFASPSTVSPPSPPPVQVPPGPGNYTPAPPPRQDVPVNPFGPPRPGQDATPDNVDPSFTSSPAYREGLESMAARPISVADEFLKQIAQMTETVSGQRESLAAGGKPFTGIGTPDSAEAMAREFIERYAREFKEAGKEALGVGAPVDLTVTSDRARQMSEAASEYIATLRALAEENEQARKQQEESVKAQEESERRKARWRAATGRASMGDLMLGTERAQKDPRGYLMDMAGMMMSGPIMARMQGMFSGTIGGAMRGFQMGGVAGAALGAAAGAGQDAINLGGAANPQAGATFDQSFNLLKTRTGSTLGADIWLDQFSRQVQDLDKLVGSNKGGVRGFSGEAAAYYGEAPSWARTAGMGMAGMYGLAAATYGRLTGKEAPKETKPDMMAPPILPGVGGAVGSAASYEQYALSLGMSSLHASPIDQQRVLEQLENMVGKLTRVVDNTESLRNFAPAWR